MDTNERRPIGEVLPTLSRSTLTFSDGSSFGSGKTTTTTSEPEALRLRPCPIVQQVVGQFEPGQLVSCHIRATTRRNRAALGGRGNTDKHGLTRENVEFARVRNRPEANSQAENAGSIPVTRSMRCRETSETVRTQTSQSPTASEC
jgi:hypothetical protein